MNSVYVAALEEDRLRQGRRRRTPRRHPEDAAGARAGALGRARRRLAARDRDRRRLRHLRRPRPADRHTVIKEVRGRNGGVLIVADPIARAALRPERRRHVNYALRKVVTDGTGSRRARRSAAPPRARPARPTRTSRRWFAGYTPDLAAAVMLTKDGEDGLPVSLSGVGGLSTVTGGSFPARDLDRVHEGRARGPARCRSSPSPRTCRRPAPRRPRARSGRPPRPSRRP